MKGAIVLFVLVAASAAAATAARAQEDGESRGFLTDAADFWDAVSESIDEIQERAGEELKKLRPALTEAESRIDSAGDQLATALDSFASAFTGFGGVDRIGEVEEEQSEEPMHPQLSLDSLLRFGRPDDDSIEGNEDESHRPSYLGSLLGLPSMFGLPMRPWFEGPNVCIERKVFNEDKKKEKKKKDDPIRRRRLLPFFGFSGSFRSCADGPDYHECKHVEVGGGPEAGERTEVVRYECCYGYGRSARGGDCEKLELETLKETLGQMEFVQLAEAVGVGFDAKNVTVFVPSDDAVEDFRRDMEEVNAVAVTGEEDGGIAYNVDDGLLRSQNIDAKLVDIVKGHFVEGFMSANDLIDGARIRSHSGGHITLAVDDVYGERVVMANCARVTSKNRFATDGVAHIVDRVVVPATHTVAELLRDDVHLRSFAAAVRAAGMEEKLSDGASEFTVFAPTDDAVAKMDAGLRSKLLSGKSCGKDILRNHIVPDTVCGGVIEDKARTRNLLNKMLTLRADGGDKLFVDGVEVAIRDVVATNGVVHVIEDVIVPESARSIGEALEGTTEELRAAVGDRTNVTVFVPPTTDPEAAAAAAAAAFHVAQPKRCRCELKNNDLLPTAMKGKSVRINVYVDNDIGYVFGRPVYTAQCVKMLNRGDDEEDVCEGAVYALERPMAPPAGSVVEILKAEHPKFYELVKFAELDDEMEELDEPITVFAPSDEAFEELTEDERRSLFESKALAEEAVKKHVVGQMICCAGMQRTNPFFAARTYMTSNNEVVSVRKSHSGRLYFAHAEVKSCDKTADDGVVHAIDDVVLPLSVGGKTVTNGLYRFMEMLQGGKRK